MRRARAEANERTERIEALRGLVGLLCAPDLTLAEAKGLRNRLNTLLGRDPEDLESESESDRSVRACCVLA